MNLEIIKLDNENIAVISSNDIIIADTQSALDFFMTVKYDNNASAVAINKEAVAEDFFVLSTGLAGGIIQKLVNYHIKAAVYGDYSKYTSKPLKDFIYECNCGKDIFFTNTKEDAINKLMT